jgi:hypothetical protein
MNRKSTPTLGSRALPLIALLSAGSFGANAWAEESLATAYLGTEYSRGKFGQAVVTETWLYPVSVKYEQGPYTLKASISYLTIKGPANVVGGGDDFIALGGTAATRSVSGWGDLVVSGAWSAYESAAARWLVDLGAKIKFGTADATRGLGTGENDYSLQVDAYKGLGPGTAFATLGRRKMGDPAGTDLRDPWFASIGWSQRLSPRTSVGLMYDFRQPVVAGHEPAREVTAFVSRKLGSTWKLQGYAVGGFSTASPDAAIGLMLSASY